MNPLLLDVLARERLADRARQLEHHTQLQAARAAQAQARAAARVHARTPALGLGNVPTAARRSRPRPLGPLGVPVARLLRALAARLEPTPLVGTPTRTDHVRISLYARR